MSIVEAGPFPTPPGITPTRVGPKTPVRGQAVVSTQSGIVSQVMADVLRAGGNAADAGVAGVLTQATVQQDMTNHGGTVSLLYYDAASGVVHELNSMGTTVPGLPLFRQVPVGRGLYTAAPPGPHAVVPGFMPGLGALHSRFGTQSWSSLVEPAIHWAEEGHVVESFEHLVVAQTVDFFLFSASGREHWLPGGHLPQVGDRWKKPVLAATLRRLAANGPEEFTHGQWAEEFVERGNDLGWKVKLDDLSSNPPRWGSPLTYRHRGKTVAQLSPPERQAVFCAIVLGVMERLGAPEFGHFSSSPKAAWAMAHALRRAHLETGYVNDPAVFRDASAGLISAKAVEVFADAIADSLPNVDLTEHVTLTRGPNLLRQAGSASKQPAGSCECTVVDKDGNWLQLMNTLQSGGIPGEVVGGVPMVGSHEVTGLASPMSGWLAEGSRLRSVLACTMVLEEGRPVLSLGSPGNVHCTPPQVLSNILDYGMAPYDADDAPRMLPLGDDYTLSIEARYPGDFPAEMAKLGVLVNALPAYDYHMGTYQMAWRDGDAMAACTGPRRAGLALGLDD